MIYGISTTTTVGIWTDVNSQEAVVVVVSDAFDAAAAAAVAAVVAVVLDAAAGGGGRDAQHASIADVWIGLGST